MCMCFKLSICAHACVWACVHAYVWACVHACVCAPVPAVLAVASVVEGTPQGEKGEAGAAPLLMSSLATLLLPKA